MSEAKLSEEQAELMHWIAVKQEKAIAYKSAFVTLNRSWVMRGGNLIANSLVKKGYLRASYYYQDMPSYSLSEEGWKVIRP